MTRASFDCSSHLAKAACALCLASAAGADIPTELDVDAGSFATVTLSITIVTDLGSETQVDSAVVPVTGGGNGRFRSDYEPFPGIDLDSMQFDVGNATLNYGFFCDSIFGCIDVTVQLTSIDATLLAPAGSDFDGGGRGYFDSVWNLNADYVIDSSLSSSNGVLDTNSNIPFAANFSAGGGDVFVHQLALGSISTEIPGDFDIFLVTDFDLADVTMSGEYEELPPASCGSSGYCGGVHAEPGCDDIDCCAAVCEVDFYCCDIGWDAHCANRAVQLCGIAPANDSCGNARPLDLGRHPFTTLNAGTDGPVLITECQDPWSDDSFVNDVWFTHEALADNGIFISTCGHADFDTQIAVYDQCDGTLVACNNDVLGCPGGTSQVGFQGVQGETYLIRLGGVQGSGSGEIDIAWGDVAQPYPAIAVEWPISEGGNGHHYTLYALGDGTTYASALAAAQYFGGYPATLTSPEEQAFVTRNMPGTLQGGSTAIGLVQEGGKEPYGGWGWITGEPFTWSNWAPGEPNDLDGGEDWGMLYQDGTWNDNPDNFAYVLIEFEEDPELEEVTWPVEAGGNGNTYQAVILPERMDWTDARIHAENRGGMLVCLETAEESAWVFRNLTAFVPLWTMTGYNIGPWVGLFERRGEWVWLSDEPFDGHAWFPGEPNGSGDRGGYFAFPDSSGVLTETFGPDASGDLFGSAQYADVFGNHRLKLVSDAFPGTWGTWSSPPVDGTVTAFEVSFRFSFKNENGGPGDGFSLLWGDLSDTSGNRMEGGEWGTFGFQQDQAGLSVGLIGYAGSSDNGIDVRWGGERIVHVPFDFSSVTYSDYQQAGMPENMPMVTVRWDLNSGVTVSIALPSNPPVIIHEDAGITELSGIDPSGWSFGFAGRNGGIDQDVLVGDLVALYDLQPTIGGLGGGPRGTIDDTYDENHRRTIIIEFAPMVPCPGDIDGDGVVDGADLTLLLGAWGDCAPDPAACLSDLNEDGTVNGADLSVLLGGWGVCPGP